MLLGRTTFEVIKGQWEMFLCRELEQVRRKHERELLELHGLCNGTEMRALFRNMIFLVEMCLDFATSWIFRQGGVGGM